MKVALVHDWLLQQRGGEQVLLQLARLFPQAPIYTLVHAPGSVHPELEARDIHTSWVQRWPGAPRRFRVTLPLLHRTVARFDLSAYDLVVSTSHCVAVAATTGPHQRHLCYVHSPMRYLYDQMDHYLPPRGRALTRPLARLATAGLRRRDRQAGRRPDRILANAHFVAARIQAAWGRTASVVHPPVDVAAFAGPGPSTASASASASASPSRPRRGWLCVNALVPYKRTDVCVRWASAAGAPLTVVGTGPEAASLRRLAGPSVRFVDKLPQAALQAALAGAEGLLYAGEEDFGITPVEALAAGCPVVALARGGVPESIVAPDGTVLGALFAEATPAHVGRGVAALRRRRAAGTLTDAACQARARAFGPATFQSHVLSHLRDLLPPHHAAQLPGLPEGP